MRRLLSRVAGPFREFGFFAGSLYLVDRILRTISPRLGLQVYEFIEQQVPDLPLLPPQRTRHLSFAEIGANDPALAQMPARPDIKAARLRSGATCLGAYRKGELIGYVWFSRGRYAEDEVRCTYVLQPTNDSVFDFDLYVLPAHRMGFAFVSIWHGANLYLKSLGVRRSFSRMTRFNLASRRSHAHLGGRTIGRACFLLAWRLELMLATVPPFAGVTISDRRRVMLRLNSQFRVDTSEDASQGAAS